MGKRCPYLSEGTSYATGGDRQFPLDDFEYYKCTRRMPVGGDDWAESYNCFDLQDGVCPIDKKRVE